MRNWVIAAAIFGLGFTSGIMLVKYRSGIISDRLATEINNAKGAEDAAKRYAESFKQAALDAKGKADEAGKRASDLKEQLRRLRQNTIAPTQPNDAGASSEPNGVCPNVDDGGIQRLVVNLNEVISVQDKIISTQDEQIANLNDVIKNKDLQIGSLEKALKQADLKADLQAQATKAAMKGIKAAKWINRGEGFLAGALVGYASGGFR